MSLTTMPRGRVEGFGSDAGDARDGGDAGDAGDTGDAQNMRMAGKALATYYY